MRYLIEQRVTGAEPPGSTRYDSTKTGADKLRELALTHDVIVIPKGGQCEFDAGFFAAMGKRRLRADTTAEANLLPLLFVTGVGKGFGPTPPGHRAISHFDLSGAAVPEAELTKALTGVGGMVIGGLKYSPVGQITANDGGWRGRYIGAALALVYKVYTIDPDASEVYHRSVRVFQTVDALLKEYHKGAD